MMPDAKSENPLSLKHYSIDYYAVSLKVRVANSLGLTLSANMMNPLPYSIL
jgi:hypothetical protein